MATKKQREWAAKEQNAAFLRAALDTYHLPPIDISDPKEVSIRIEWYFQHCLETETRPVISGIANAIGCSRDSLLNWANGIKGSTPEHQFIARRAVALCEELMESYITNSAINPIAGMFLMTNNFAGWQNHAEKNPREFTPEIGTSEEALRKRYISNTITPPIPVPETAESVTPPVPVADEPQKKAGDD